MQPSVLVAVRTAWALLQARRRPLHLTAMAKWATVRCMEARKGDLVEWMVDLGSLLHGELGWVLLALVVGHVGMAIWHRRGRQDVLPRIMG